MLKQLPHPGVPQGPKAGSGSAPPAEAAAGATAGPAAAGLLDAGALDRLRELDPKGENRLLQRVLAAFQSSTERLVPQLREASAAGDLAGMRHVAHTLKSSSASIGAVGLSRQCAELESMIRLGTLESPGARVEAMCTEIETVLRALRDLLDSPP